MPRRSSIVLISIATHVMAIATLLIASIVAPGVLPFPRDVLAAPVERIVQIPDVPPPVVKRPRVQAPGAAPLLQPDRLPTSEPEMPLVVPRGITVESDTGIAGDFNNVGTSIVGVPTVQAPAVSPADTRRPIRMHSGIKAPVKVADRRPEYPAIARQAGVQGIVIIELTITETGEVASAHVLRSIAVLDQAALDAVRAWRFEPAQLNGEPVAVIMAVTVNFQLAR